MCNGVVVWKTFESRRVAEEEPESPEQGNERSGPGKDQNGTAREKDHSGH